MPTRSSQNWQSKPGYFDPLHLANSRYPALNKWGIPQLARVKPRTLPDSFVAYGYRARSRKLDGQRAATHFFLDDYRFESVWRHPNKALQAVGKYPFVLTPDFSLYRDWPLAAQLWNVYRNRWCGIRWQRQGLTVIPTVSWSSAESFDFCFLGITKGSVVAVSAVGVDWRRDLLEKTVFVSGFQALVNAIEPAAVVAYGVLPPECADLAATIVYPTRWEQRRKAVQ